MEEGKLGKCISEPLCCPDAMMQPLTIKTEQAKRACNTCLTNSPKKVCYPVLDHPHAPLVCSTLGFLSILALLLVTGHTHGRRLQPNEPSDVGRRGRTERSSASQARTAAHARLGASRRQAGASLAGQQARPTACYTCEFEQW